MNTVTETLLATKNLMNTVAKTSLVTKNLQTSGQICSWVFLGFKSFFELQIVLKHNVGYLRSPNLVQINRITVLNMLVASDYPEKQQKINYAEILILTKIRT